MRWFKKTILALSAAGLGFLALASYSRYRDYQIVRNYVESHEGNLVQNLEGILNIKFRQMPHIKYDLLPDLTGNRIGYYIPGTDTIYLMPSKYITTSRFITVDFFEKIDAMPFFDLLRNSNSKIAEIVDSQLPVKTFHLELFEDTFNHELGHYYMDIKLEELKRMQLPIYGNGLLSLLIDEGVATYFEIRRHGEYLAANGRGRYSTDTRPMVDNPDVWPNFRLESMESIGQMHGRKEEGLVGYILIKPILDKSVEKGVVELIKNPLQERDLTRPSEYQRKIIESLAKQ